MQGSVLERNLSLSLAENPCSMTFLRSSKIWSSTLELPSSSSSDGLADMLQMSYILNIATIISSEVTPACSTTRYSCTILHVGKSHGNTTSGMSFFIFEFLA